MIVTRFRRSILWRPEEDLLRERWRTQMGAEVERVQIEHCFYVETSRLLRPAEAAVLDWLLAETFEPGSYGDRTGLAGMVIEVGPRLGIITPWSTNATKICHSCGLDSIRRLERSRRYGIQIRTGARLTDAESARIISSLYDRMTEMVYPEPLATLASDQQPQPVRLIPLREEGIFALQRANDELGLAFDSPLMDHIYRHFAQVLGTNPTDVTCFHLGQALSDHSRHRRFNALWRIDGVEKTRTLMDTIRTNYERHPGHTVVGIGDNASSIRGHRVPVLVNSQPIGPSPMVAREIDVEATANGESHNHPTAIASSPGAATGTGGRIRDNQAVGRGGSVVAGSTLYLVGNPRIPGYELPWEKENWEHPYRLETPLQIILGAPRGAYRYGNEFGEPTLSGSTTAFEYVHEGGEEPELFGFTKCGMWTVGLGWIDQRHLQKQPPEAGLQIVQLGGDAYRIGLGGGSGSSKVAGTQEAELDWNSVQRANAEMEKVVDRVVQACIMMGEENPIWTMTDLGAGGDCNAVTELISPAGGQVYLRRIPCGDRTMSVLEIWCNESQERLVLLVWPDKLPLLEQIARREKCPLAVIGEITGEGRLALVDEAAPAGAPAHEREPVNLDLGFALGKIPQLVLKDNHLPRPLRPLSLPEGLTVAEALNRVLRLLKVSAKGFLVNHVDRSVTGLVAQQQCVGPLQLPVADVAVTADSHFATTGRAWGIGDQPNKWILSPAASVRLAAGEALTNLMWAPVEEFEGISFLGNWGIAASEPGEGARLHDANEALDDLLDRMGVSINGGKDSMSMATLVRRQGVDLNVKAPGTMVATAYAACSDLTRTVTPDLKQAGQSKLMFIDLAGGQTRLGGSALAQVYEQMGNESPDVDDPRRLRRGFEAMQHLIKADLILAGHDRSDGGLITCLLEMAFAGNCGLEIDLPARRPGLAGALALLFAEELGAVIEYAPEKEPAIAAVLHQHGLGECYQAIGRTTTDQRVNVRYGEELVLAEDVPGLRDIWQETSFQLERLQINPRCAESERRSGRERRGLQFGLTFQPRPTPERWLRAEAKPRIAILREEGTNGDREMAAAFFHAGFEPWDLTMTDLAEGRIGLRDFRGVAFCGGFSYGDVLDAGKGWAGVVRFDSRIRDEFDAFYHRPDTFSLGVCNGCQMMALLGWIPWSGIEPARQPRFVLNESTLFESRFVAVKPVASPSIFLRNMEGSVLGIWVAHGEGRFLCPDDSLLQAIQRQDLMPLRYVDDEGQISEEYPCNPNGSKLGVAALCSPDGRHLAVMPHPERIFLPWQWPYWPEQWSDLRVSPWLQLFQNARQWCEE